MLARAPFWEGLPARRRYLEHHSSGELERAANSRGAAGGLHGTQSARCTLHPWHALGTLHPLTSLTAPQPSSGPGPVGFIMGEGSALCREKSACLRSGAQTGNASLHPQGAFLRSPRRGPIRVCPDQPWKGPYWRLLGAVGGPPPPRRSRRVHLWLLHSFSSGQSLIFLLASITLVYYTRSSL